VTTPTRGHDPAGGNPAEPRPLSPATPGHGNEPGAAELIARLRVPGELTAADVAALARLDGGRPDPDDPMYDSDPGYDGPDSWPAGLPDDDGEPAELGGAAVPETLEAGFAHRYGGNGTGFAAGGPLDAMLPGPGLAWHIGQARQRGLALLSDDELCGVLNASRRLGSWQAELELAAVAELDARRAGPDGREGEHVTEEIAAVLTLTGRSAGTLLELSHSLQQLPQTQALLAAGIIDRARAAVIADQLSILSDADAAAVEDRVARRASGLTTGQLRAACQRAVLTHDPRRRSGGASRPNKTPGWSAGPSPPAPPRWPDGT
jgi:hypothetical protein